LTKIYFINPLVPDNFFVEFFDENRWVEG